MPRMTTLSCVNMAIEKQEKYVAHHNLQLDERQKKIRNLLFAAKRLLSEAGAK